MLMVYFTSLYVHIDFSYGNYQGNAQQKLSKNWGSLGFPSLKVPPNGLNGFQWNRPRGQEAMSNKDAVVVWLF